MTEYKDSDWTDGVFVDKFLDAVYLKVPQRQRMFELAASYYRHFLSDRTGNVILDLGCGDGILTKELLEVRPSQLSLSTPHRICCGMPERSLQRTIGYATFMPALNLIGSKTELGPFDMAVSSLAIHHLTLKDKRRLFELIFGSLNPGGHFLQHRHHAPAHPVAGSLVPGAMGGMDASPLR